MVTGMSTERRHASTSTPSNRPAAAITGCTVILATDPAASVEFFTELGEVVRQWHGAVLITKLRPAAWRGGPVVGIHLRRENDPPQLLGAGIWFGPLREAPDRHALCDWLRGGGPLGGAPPERLRPRVLAAPPKKIVAWHTAN
jgi:hypothetical protein